MRPIYVTKQLATADPDGYAQSQTPGAAGALTLNGALVVSGVGVADTARQVLLTFAADETGHSFVVTGTDGRGLTMSETIAGTTAGTVASLGSYKTVTSITISAAATGAILAGTNAIGATNPIPTDRNTNPTSMRLAVEVTGTVNYTVQETFDDIYDLTLQSDEIVWFNITALTAKAANENTGLVTPNTAVRLVINSGAGSAKLCVVQSGPI